MLPCLHHRQKCFFEENRDEDTFDKRDIFLFENEYTYAYTQRAKTVGKTIIELISNKKIRPYSMHLFIRADIKNK